MKPETLEAERSKYRRIWTREEYKGSPGLRVAPLAFEWFQDLACTSLTDWGCGDGQAMEWFRARAIHVQGVDLVDVAPDHLNVTVAPLHDPQGAGASDFAFSADVLEHLPPTAVDPSLEAIEERTSVGGFFQIATTKDSCGDLIGERLHLTVESGEWWLDKVGEYFDVQNQRILGSKVQIWFWK